MGQRRKIVLSLLILILNYYTTNIAHPLLSKLRVLCQYHRGLFKIKQEIGNRMIFDTVS